MNQKLNQLLKEWQSLLPKIKKQLSQLTNANTQLATIQTQLNEITQQKTVLQNQINQLQKQVLNQSDKNLLSQCASALNIANTYWNSFPNWQSYHTWFNNAPNIENGGAKEDIKNTACHLRNYLNTSKNIVEQKNNLQTQLNESNRKVETITKENSENEKVLNQIFTEMQQLAGQLN